MVHKIISPFAIFKTWYEEAKTTEINDPNAMALATIGLDGFPNVRIVLLKAFDEEGFVFYTNFNSNKGQELQNCDKASLCFHWKTLQKQIRIKGVVKRVSEEEADSYFASRPRLSQIGAWASKQSHELAKPFDLAKNIAYYNAKFALSKIPRPPHWSGFRLKPCSFEFWRAGKFRLHKRLQFYLSGGAYSWHQKKLYP